MKSFIVNIISSFLIIITLLTSCKKEEKFHLPVVVTFDITNITCSSASSGGNILDDGGLTIFTRGVCWNTHKSPRISDYTSVNGSGVDTFTSQITGLSPATVYYVRAYATNNQGAGYGAEVSFKTLGDIPTVSTEPATSILPYSATLNGIVNANHLSTIVTFEYGLNPNYGLEVTAEQNPLNEGGNKNVYGYITKLTAGTTYHFRIKAVNELGTITGNSLTFTTTIPLTPIIDVDGNSYNIVKIGTQFWMAENLKVAHYNNGDPIPNVLNSNSWSFLTTGAYCDYANSPNNSITYGKLYNWYAVTDTRNLCPSGWHIPSDSEWSVLAIYLGGDRYAADKLKEIGSLHWQSPITNANNETGFTALPGGFRESFGDFHFLGCSGHWWSTTEFNKYYAWSRGMYSHNSYLSRNYNHKPWGFSVRCVKDF